MTNNLQVLYLGQQSYLNVSDAMRTYTEARQSNDPDKILLLEHTPTYTTGQSYPISYDHIGNIPVIPTDRGGKITYHGPGQLIIYPLIDLRRQKLSPHQLIHILEQSVLDYVTSFSLTASSDPDARGVYIQEKKVASIGLRIKRFCSLHGISINVENRCLEAFDAIETCGNPNLKVVSLDQYVKDITTHTVIRNITPTLIERISEFNPYASIQDQHHEQTTRARQAIKNPH